MPDFRCASTLLLALAGANVGASELLLPGDYHGDEVSARDQEVWLAVVHGTNSQTRIEPRPIDIDAVNDPVLDDVDGASGKRVGAQHDDVLFYVRDVPGATPGAVTSALVAHGEPRSIDLGLDHVFILDRRPVGRLWLDCVGDPAQSRCALKLARNGREQTLATWSAQRQGEGTVLLGNDAWPHLRWAGDLDRDGQIDLLIDTSDHYNVSQPTLFLSTQAKADELVGKAAVLRSVGC